MKRSLASLLIAVLLLGGVSGCSTKPKGNFNLSPRRITIHTEPEGADVTQLQLLGQPALKLGTTPINDLTVSVLTNVKMKNMPLSEAQKVQKHFNNAVVKITKEGYQPYSATIHTTADKTSIIKIKLIEK